MANLTLVLPSKNLVLPSTIKGNSTCQLPKCRPLLILGSLVKDEVFGQYDFCDHDCHHGKRDDDPHI